MCGCGIRAMYRVECYMIVDISGGIFFLLLSAKI